MTELYLGGYVGSGVDGDEFRPAAFDWVEGASAIDLRPDPSRVDGVCLVRSPERLRGAGLLHLGDDLDGRLPVVVHERFQNRLALNLARRRLRRTVGRLLAVHGSDRNPRRWNRLRPEVDGRYRVWLGELVYDKRLVFGDGGVVLLDSFDRADNADMSVDAPFPWTDVAGDHAIVTNAARNVPSTGSSASRAESDLVSPNHYAQSLCNSSTSTLVRTGPCVRFDPSAQTYYVCRRPIDNTVAAGLGIAKVIAGTVTSLASATMAGSGSQTVRIEANGSTISATCAAVVIGPVTDVSLTTGRRTGIHSQANAINRSIFFDFEAGDLVHQGWGLDMR